MTRQKYLQLIHIAANQLKLDEETYRQLLKNLTGQSSAKSLSTIDLNPSHYTQVSAGKLQPIRNDI